MKNVITIGIIVIVLGNAIWYLIRNRKKGVKCIGCPGGGCSQCSEGKNCYHSHSDL